MPAKVGERGAGRESAARAFAARVGQEIRKHRKALGLSLEELARRVGVSLSLISQIELGDCAASLVVLHKIAGALELSVEDLVAEEKAIVQDQRQQAEALLRDRGVPARIEGRRVFMDLAALLDLLRGRHSIGSNGSNSCGK